MRRVPLGPSGLDAPNVTLGLMRIQEKTDDEVRELVRTARDAGIDFFDHADVYGADLHGCEARFAEAMALTPSERAEIAIQTKAGIVREGPYFDFSYEHIVRSVEGSLRALKTDYIDILSRSRSTAAGSSSTPASTGSRCRPGRRSSRASSPGPSSARPITRSSTR